MHAHSDHEGRCQACGDRWPCEVYQRACHTAHRLTEPEWMGWARADEYRLAAWGDPLHPSWLEGHS